MAETLFTKAITLEAGSETFVAVRRVFTSKLKHPYSDCLSKLKPFSNYSAKLFSYFNELNVTYYDQEFCYYMCYQDQLADKCYCSDIETKKIRNVTYCSTEEEINCMNDFRAFFSTTDLKTLCYFSCPIQCDSIKYELKTHQLTYPTEWYVLNLIIQKSPFVGIQSPDPYDVLDDNYKLAKQSFIKMIVNYDDLTSTFIIDSPKFTFEQLLGNVGGQLGLFVGVSLLTTLELIELLIYFFIITYRHFYPKNE